MKSKRTVVSFLIGVGIFIGVAGGAYAWVEGRVNDKAREIAPVVSEVIEAKGDPDEIARMTGSPKYNGFSLTWIIHTDFGVQSSDSEAVKNAVTRGAYHTNDYELFTFMEAVDDHVTGLSPERAETYSQAGALDSFIKLDMPKEFVGAWNECRQNLADRYESYFAYWALISEMAFPDNEPACPSLKRSAEKLSTT